MHSRNVVGIALARCGTGNRDSADAKPNVADRFAAEAFL
jgi:hypothetical protein